MDTNRRNEVRNYHARLTLAHLRLLYACSEPTAYQRKKEIMDYYNNGRDYITFAQYCDYEGLNPDEMAQYAIALGLPLLS